VSCEEFSVQVLQEEQGEALRIGQAWHHPSIRVVMEVVIVVSSIK
jgi:hypothetical protein